MRTRVGGRNWRATKNLQQPTKQQHVQPKSSLILGLKLCMSHRKGFNDYWSPIHDA